MKKINPIYNFIHAKNALVLSWINLLNENYIASVDIILWKPLAFLEILFW